MLIVLLTNKTLHIPPDYQSLFLKKKQQSMCFVDCRFMKACGSHDKQWRDGRQHDAQEFLRSILEAMQVSSFAFCLILQSRVVMALLL